MISGMTLTSHTRWSEAEAGRWAAATPDPLLGLRVYTSRLLGADPSLVLHGGGNTSVKSAARDVLGEEVEVVWVKASGWDLATIEAQGSRRWSSGGRGGCSTRRRSPISR